LMYRYMSLNGIAVYKKQKPTLYIY